MDSDPTDSQPAKPRRRWWQFSLRLVLVLVTLSTLPLAWLAMKLREAETQKQAVAAWVKLHVEVEYSNRPRVPRWLGGWLLELMGKDAYYLKSVSVRTRRELREMTRVRRDLSDLGDAIYAFDGDGSGQMLRRARADMAKQFAKYDAELKRLRPLDDQPFAALEDLEGIELLDLVGTQVTDATLAQLTHLAELETLYLAQTRITDAGMAHLANLTELKFLDLKQTRVTDVGLRHVRGMTKLRYFGPPPSLGDAGLACLKNLTELTQLVAGDRLTDAGLRHLRKMTKLHTLIVTAPITGEGLVHLQPLASLRNLCLTRSNITDKTIAHVKHLPQLEFLGLSQSLVTDAGLMHLRSCQHLSDLSLTDPHVSSKGVAELRKALPKCTIRLGPWPGPDKDLAQLYSASDEAVRLADSRTYADGSRGFHLAGPGDSVPLYLVHRAGPADAHFTNLYLVGSLDDPHPTRLDRLLFGDELCKRVHNHLEAVLSNDGVMQYDKNARLVQATRKEILKRHGKQRGEPLLQLRVVWQELRERYATSP